MALDWGQNLLRNQQLLQKELERPFWSNPFIIYNHIITISDTEFDLCFGRPLKIHLCFNSWPGVIRSIGFHVNHARMNFSNSESSMFSCRPAGTTGSFFGCCLNTPYSSKNILYLLARSNISEGGYPRSSTNRFISSSSHFPRNRGLPVASSYTTHPKDHTSIEVSYGIPSIISGLL